MEHLTRLTIAVYNVVTNTGEEEMSKPSTPSKKRTKYYPDSEKYFFLRKRPISDVIIDDYAKNYIEWATNEEDALRAQDFPLLIGMYPKSFRNLMDRHEGLRRAHEVVKSIIASRREKGAINKKYDTSMIKHSMPLYDHDWKKLCEWYGNIKVKEDEAKKRDITVLMAPMPATDAVPEK